MTEELKSWVLLLLLGALIGIGYIIHYFGAVDDANLALQDSKVQLQNVQQMVALRKKDWHEKQQVAAKLQSEVAKTAALVKSQESLETRYHKAESELSYLANSIKSAVEKVRANAPGTELGEITLADNRILRGVKIRKVDESGVSMIHSEGIGTIPVEMLPESLKEQYDLGSAALVPLLQNAHTALVAKKDGKDPAEVKPSPAPAAPSAAQVAEQAKLAANIALDAKIKGIKIKIAQLESQIANCVALANQYKNAAKEHQNLASAAKGRGTPSSRHTTNANENLAQVAAIERQIEALRVDQKKLNLDIDYAQKNR